MNAPSRPALGHAFRRAALPLGWYYTITLVLPIANGATQAGAAFGGHALIVLVVPPLLIVMSHAVRVAIGHSLERLSSYLLDERWRLRDLVNASATCRAKGSTPLASATLAAAAIARPRSGNVRSETVPPRGLPR